MNAMRLLSRTSDFSMPSLLAAGVIVGTVMVVTYAPGTAIAQEVCDSETENLLCTVTGDDAVAGHEYTFDLEVSTMMSDKGFIYMNFTFDTEHMDGLGEEPEHCCGVNQPCGNDATFQCGPITCALTEDVAMHHEIASQHNAEPPGVSTIWNHQVWVRAIDIQSDASVVDANDIMNGIFATCRFNLRAGTPEGTTIPLMVNAAPGRTGAQIEFYKKVPNYDFLQGEPICGIDPAADCNQVSGTVTVPEPSRTMLGLTALFGLVILRRVSGARRV
ncbi:MAG: hypothetical protein AAEJ52_12845 [Myxococcota bacterium]